jgi:hypothetical protein
MESLCNALTGTYNTNILETASPLTQAVFISESTKHKEGEKGRVVLMDLILNHRAAKMPEPGLIGGPFTLSLHQSKKDQKIIYIFGENHSDIMDCERLVRKKTEAELVNGCPEGKIRNPGSGMCVKRTGNIGLQIVSENNARSENGSSKPTMPIETFLTSLLRTTDVFVDVFLEVPAYTGTGYSQTDRGYLVPSRMQSLLTMVGDCIEEKTRDGARCRFGRVHYTDIRKLNHSSVGAVSEFRKMWQMEIGRQADRWDAFRGGRSLLGSLAMYQKIKALMDRPVGAEVARKLGSGTDKEYLAFWRDQVFENPFVKKELERSYLRNEISAFALETVDREAMEQRSTFIQLYERANQAVKDVDANSTPHVNAAVAAHRKIYMDAMEGIYTRTVGINSAMVDIYTLARIFKVFSGRHDDAPDEPRNIILYYGNEHANRVRAFLGSQGYDMLNATEVPRYVKNCVNVESFPTPFFNVPTGGTFHMGPGGTGAGKCTLSRSVGVPSVCVCAEPHTHAP